MSAHAYNSSAQPKTRSRRKLTVDTKWFPKTYNPSDVYDIYKYNAQNGQWYFRVKGEDGQPPTFTKFSCEFGDIGFKFQIHHLVTGYLNKFLDDMEMRLMAFLVNRLTDVGQTSYGIRYSEIIDGRMWDNMGGGGRCVNTIKKAWASLEAKGIIKAWKADTMIPRAGRAYDVTHYAIDYDGMNEFLKEKVKEHEVIRESKRSKRSSQRGQSNRVPENDPSQCDLSTIDDPSYCDDHIRENNTSVNREQYIFESNDSEDSGALLNNTPSAIRSGDVESPSLVGTIVVSPMDTGIPRDCLNNDMKHTEVITFGEGKTNPVVQNVQSRLLQEAQDAVARNAEKKAAKAAGCPVVPQKHDGVRITPEGHLNTNDLIKYFHDQGSQEYELYTYVAPTMATRGKWANKIKNTVFPNGETMVGLVDFVITYWVSIQENHFEHWLSHLSEDEQARRAYPPTPNIDFVMANFKIFLNAYVKHMQTGLTHRKTREKLRAIGYKRAYIDNFVKEINLSKIKVDDEKSKLDKIKKEISINKIKMHREVEIKESQLNRRSAALDAKEDAIRDREDAIKDREAQARNRPQLPLENAIMAEPVPVIQPTKVYTDEELKDLSIQYDLKYSEMYNQPASDPQRLANIHRALKVHGVGNCDGIIECNYKTY